MANQLTVLMTCLDEGAEVDRTMASIRATAADAVDIVFVNDSSTDGFDYAAAAERHGAVYIENPARRGSGRARDIGVEQVRTPNVVIVDSHMRFHEDDWWNRINAAIADDPRAVYCTKCEVLDQAGAPAGDPSRNNHGAWIRFEGDQFDDILEPKWLSHAAFDAPLIDIPCVLGATYSVDVAYYQKLGGMLGIRGWGVEEVYLSLKAWREGGRCRLITDVEIGHKFKDAADYPISWSHVHYNKLLVCETVLSAESGAQVSALLAKLPADDARAHARAVARIEEQREALARLRAYYESIFTRSFEEVRALIETTEASA